MFDKEAFVANWKDRKSFGGFERVPDGVYCCILKEAKIAKTPNGCTQFSLQWITNGDEDPANRTIWQNQNLTSKTGARNDIGYQIAAETLARLGVTDPEEFANNQEQILKALSGTEARIKVQSDSNNPQWYKAYIQYGDVKSTLEERVGYSTLTSDSTQTSDDEIEISEGMEVLAGGQRGKILTIIEDTNQVVVEIEGEGEVFDISSLTLLNTEGEEEEETPFEVKEDIGESLIQLGTKVFFSVNKKKNSGIVVKIFEEGNTEFCHVQTTEKLFKIQKSVLTLN